MENGELKVFAVVTFNVTPQVVDLEQGCVVFEVETEIHFVRARDQAHAQVLSGEALAGDWRVGAVGTLPAEDEPLRFTCGIIA